MERARSFGAVAALYDRARPDPPAALAELLAPLGGRDVLDLAAGTGKLTRLLAGAGARVASLEPDEAMRAVLVARSPEVALVGGTAEAIEAPDASFDLVTVSSAWHWFAQPAATDEVARVLRDGGRVAVLGNGLDRDDPVAELLVGLRAAEETPAARRAHEAHEDLEAGPFEGLSAVDLPWCWTRDLAQLGELMSTYSAVIALREERRRALLDEMARALAPASRDGVVEVGMRVRGVLGVRQAR